MADAQVALTSLFILQSPDLNVRETISFGLVTVINSTGNPICLATNPAKKNFKYFLSYFLVNFVAYTYRFHEKKIPETFPQAPVGIIIFTFSSGDCLH